MSRLIDDLLSLSRIELNAHLRPEPVAAVVRDNPGLHDLIEWLGYLLEDLLEMRGACLSAGQGLDPEQFDRA